MDAYKLKCIAVCGMILNHCTIAYQAILPTWLLYVLYAAGGLTFPIMAFFVVEGYKYTSNLKKYFLRLLIFGLIAQAFYPMVLGIGLNIMFTIMLGLAVLVMYDKIKLRPLFWLLFVLSLLLSLIMDWGVIGVVIILMYHVITKEDVRRLLPGMVGGLFSLISSFSLILLVYVLMTNPRTAQYARVLYENMGNMRLTLASLTFVIGCVAGAFLLKSYNGKRGKKAKYLFYVSYPLHLAILGLTVVALGLKEFRFFI